MKMIIPWIFAFVALTPCAAHFDRSAAFVEYEQAVRGADSHASPPELQLRAHLLKLTPLGSSPRQVLHVIEDVLHKSDNGYRKNFYTPRTSAIDPDHPDLKMYVAGCTGIRYAERMSWWMTGTDTDVIWYFDDHDQLIGIVVWDHVTGL